jgi:N-acetylmuramoyl-L-alanine amidase
MKYNYYIISALIITILFISFIYIQYQQPNDSDHGALNPVLVPPDSANTTPKYDQQFIDDLITNYDMSLQYRNSQITKEGISLVQTLNIRSNPSTTWDTTILSTIEEGGQFQIIDENSRWYKINYNDNIGWVSKDYVQASSSLKTTLDTTLQLTMIDNNTLNLIGSLPFELELYNNENSTYTLSFTNLMFNDSIFNINHSNIPILKSLKNEIDIFTKGWTHANLVKVTDSHYQINFTPIVKEVEYISENNRDIFTIQTSGTPQYSFETSSNQFQLTFAQNVEVNIPSNITIHGGIFVENVAAVSDGLVINANSPVIWKVISDATSITIDISNTGISKKRIVIDPGHGGTELGTYGRQSKISEKDFNLSVAKLLQTELESEGAIVYMTRTDDSNIYQGNNYETFEDLIARVNFAIEHQADIFISLHADNFPADLSVNGTTGYYNNEVPHAKQNMQLANLISNQISQAIDTKWLGANEQSFVVIRYNPFPSALIEHGFLSNKKDEAKLISTDYQIKISKATTNAIKDYFNGGVN